MLDNIKHDIGKSSHICLGLDERKPKMNSYSEILSKIIWNDVKVDRKIGSIKERINEAVDKFSDNFDDPLRGLLREFKPKNAI